MAEGSSSEDKTEEGSEKKTRDALEMGNTPYSREASVFLSLATMLIVASLILTSRARALAGSLVELFANPTRDPFGTMADTMWVLHQAADASLAFLWPILLLLMIAGLVAGMAQGIPHLVLDRITPKFSKLSPAAGFKRLAGRDGQVEFLKSTAKFIIVTAVVTIVLRGQGEALIDTLHDEPAAVGALILRIVARLLAGSLVAYSLLTAADLVWARLKWRRDLRMTRQELKDEQKQADGDPLLKAKRRSLALDRGRVAA